LDHGSPTPRAVVFLHGITSSPVQFLQLAQRCFALGDNVVIARMPRHGAFDRLTRAPAHLSRAEYRQHAREAVAMGRGLGQHLTVAGLSVSGVLAAWTAQHCPDVDQAVLIAAAFGPHSLPQPLVPPFSRLARALPNLMVWWDPRKRARAGHVCSYPRFSTHALAECFLLGAEILHAARDTPPAARSVLSVTNPLDLAVNNRATHQLVERWRATSPRTHIREFQYGPELGHLHDIIGPYQDHAQPEYVYPILIDLIHAGVDEGS
jgi:carboxylesterase